MQHSYPSILFLMKEMIGNETQFIKHQFQHTANTGSTSQGGKGVSPTVNLQCRLTMLAQPPSPYANPIPMQSHTLTSVT